jgi:hypothetical protein
MEKDISFPPFRPLVLPPPLDRSFKILLNAEDISPICIPDALTFDNIPENDTAKAALYGLARVR